MKTLMLAIAIIGSSLFAPAALVSADTQESKESYLDKVAAELREIDDKIDALKVDARDAGDSAKAKLDLQVKRLEVQKARANVKYKEIKADTKGAWRDLRAGMDKALKDLHESLSKAKAGLKKRASLTGPRYTA